MIISLISKFNMLTWYKVILIVSIIGQIDSIIECEFILKGKCLGDTKTRFDFGSPKEDAQLLKTYNSQNYSSCSEKCDQNVQCLMASLDTETFECSLYEKISIQDKDGKIQLYIWHCCSPNISNNVPKRCPGFWKLNKKAFTDNFRRKSDPLIEFEDDTKEECEDQCLNNDICGAINVQGNGNKVLCQLIIQYPVEQLRLVSDLQWDTYQWQCAENFTLPEPPKTCTHREDYSPGYWSIHNTSSIFNNETKRLLHFQTLDYNQCLENCGLYRDCKAAWYSQAGLFCILEAYTRSTCAELIPTTNYTFTVFKWKNCDMTEFQRNGNILDNRNCGTLLNNKDVYIDPINCGQRSTDSFASYPCWIKPTDFREFSYSFHCQTNQSYIIISKEIRHNSSWFKVSTGYSIFWLTNITDLNFRTVDSLRCEIFDASMDISRFEPLRIINRTQWFAPKPYKKPKPFPNHPVKHAIITDTERPFCNCFSRESCSYVFREQQITMQPMFSSIHFSFIVTGDGIAYEARGWDYEPKLSNTKSYPDMISFAICGRYIHNPNPKSLSTIKQLIIESIKLKKLSENYTIYIYNDIINQPYPYEGLRRVIELWPHYRGYIRKDCGPPIRSETIFMSVVLVVVFLVFMIASLHIFVARIIHNKCCYSIRNCRIERIFCDFSTDSEHFDLPIHIDDLRNLVHQEINFSPITTDIYWIETYQPLFDRKKFEKNCKCCHEIFLYFDFCRLQSTLVTASHIPSLPIITCCHRKVAIIFTINELLSNSCVFILHYSDERSFDRLLTCLHDYDCICHSFRLTKYCARLIKFGTQNRTFKETLSLQRNNLCTRTEIEARYTYLIEHNNISRYY